VRWRLPSPNQAAIPVLGTPPSLPIPSTFPKLSFSIQNCNSLNISTVCDKQLTKISALCSFNTDIVFLSDLRLNSDPEHIEKIEKLFLYNKQRSYVFVHNSTKNSRGVGILLASDLNANIMSSKKDDAENILLLTISIGEHILTVTAVYGPNRDTKTFFNNLSSYLRMTSHLPSVIGGDWNTTVSTDPVDHNIDIFKMVAPPSLTRSFWLNEICEELRLCDPFRAIHPTKRDFAFDSRGARNNRSRIDFFLISENLLSTVAKCYTVPAKSLGRYKKLNNFFPVRDRLLK
jgi:exonuclease III